jgi:MerR family transcriptional regulator/heat shock protein HspR
MMNSDLKSDVENEVENDVHKPVLTLSIVSGLSGIPAHSIRQYIEKGLIIPFKLDSKRHLFSLSDVNRLKHINHLIQKNGLNFAGIRALLAIQPCWAIRHCTEQDRQNCEAYRSYTTPCWEASEKGQVCRNENCRECDVYTCLSKTADLKSMVRDTIK